MKRSFVPFSVFTSLVVSTLLAPLAGHASLTAQTATPAASAAPTATSTSTQKDVKTRALTATEKSFMTAAETGDSKKLNQFLKNSKLDLNMQDEELMTPLMAAALTGQDVIAKALLATGKMDLEKKNRVGDTALAVALGNEQFQTAKLLVQAGANIEISINGQEGVTPFMLAAGNDLDLAKIMYKKNKSVLEKQDVNGNTPLLRAVMDENIPAIDFLLSVGANKNHKNKTGLTAPLIANKSDNTKLKNALLR